MFLQPLTKLDVEIPVVGYFNINSSREMDGICTIVTKRIFLNIADHCSQIIAN